MTITELRLTPELQEAPRLHVMAPAPLGYLPCTCLPESGIDEYCHAHGYLPLPDCILPPTTTTTTQAET